MPIVEGSCQCFVEGSLFCMACTCCILVREQKLGSPQIRHGLRKLSNGSIVRINEPLKLHSMCVHARKKFGFLLEDPTPNKTGGILIFDTFLCVDKQSDLISNPAMIFKQLKMSFLPMLACEMSSLRFSFRCYGAASRHRRCSGGGACFFGHLASEANHGTNNV